MPEFLGEIGNLILNQRLEKMVPDNGAKLWLQGSVLLRLFQRPVPYVLLLATVVQEQKSREFTSGLDQ